MASASSGAVGLDAPNPPAGAEVPPPSPEEFSRFLVVGGGLAGLSAASHLSAHPATSAGSDVRLLEARNRLGGRVLTVQMAGRKAELGASWIHGVLGNPLYELAASSGLVDPAGASGASSAPHNVAAVTEDGRRMPFSVLQEVYEAYFWFFKRCEEYFLCKYRPPDGIRSVGRHVELEISIYLERFPPQQRRVRRLVFDYLLKRECCITGCDSMDEVDLVGIGSYTELPGGNVIVPAGYSALLGPILERIPEESVLKQHPVKHIHWRHRTEMEEGKNDKGYESSDGAESDASVQTVKSGAGAGEAEESASRRESAASISEASSVSSSARSSRAPSVCSTPAHQNRGRAAGHPNVMVECENGDKFYADHLVCAVPLGILKEKEDLFVPPLPEDKRQAMAKLNFGTVNKILLEYDRPFLSPDISEVILLWDPLDRPVEMKDRWFRRIYSFSKLGDSGRVLVGWISGEEALYMETLRLNLVAETCTAILKKFLADPYVPKPKSCVFTAWRNQPYSRGAYSSIGIGGTQADIEKVAEPLYHNRSGKKTPVVAFAGEHCHPSFYSTGHGAFLTGRTAAHLFLTAARAAATSSAASAAGSRSEGGAAAAEEEEDVYNLGAASVADLSTWLQEIQMGERSLEDYKSKRRSAKVATGAGGGGGKRGGQVGAARRPARDDNKFVTPR